jgi:hypothetical protein
VYVTDFIVFDLYWCIIVPIWLQRGAFPLYPSKNGLIFVPLSFELPLASQLNELDMILHKMTDEIVSIDPNCSISFPKGISFSGGMSEIIR